MGLYDNYQLQNSQLVQQYAGSALPEMVNVGRELQRRYDVAREGYDVLGQAVDSSSVYDADRPLFNKRMGQFRDGIRKAAESGRYEDMVYDVSRMSRQFATEYKPFAENIQRISAYQKDIDDRLEKGKIDADTARKLKQEISTYKGLTEESDGRIGGLFSGQSIAETLDLKDWADKAVKDIAPQVLGHQYRNIVKGEDGNYYAEQGGKTVKVPAKRIVEVLEHAKKIDPRYSAYINQKKRLDSMGYEQITPDMIENESMRNTIQQEADKYGVSFGEMYRQIKADAVERDINSHVSGYAVGKFERNDRETVDKLMSMTEASKKKLDNQESTLGVNIAIREPGSPEYSTPDKLSGAIQNQQKAVEQLGTEYAAWANTVGLNKGNDGKFYDKENQDITATVLGWTYRMANANKAREDLQELERKAMENVGFRVTTAERERAEEVGKRAAEYVTELGVGRFKDKAYDLAYKSIISNTKKYNEFKNELQRLTESKAITVYAQRFNDKEDNKAAASYLNNLAGMDGDNSLIGFRHTGTAKGKEQLTPDELKKLKGKIEFAGVHVDSEGNFQFMGKATDEKGNSYVVQTDQIVDKNGVAGISKKLGLEAGTVADQMFVRRALTNPSKTAELQYSDGTKVKFDRSPNPNDPNSGTYGTLKFTPKNGRTEVIPINDESELLKYLDAVRRY